MKAYKVLRREKGKLVSCRIKGVLKTTYSETETTFPVEGLSLLAFRTREEALIFVENLGNNWAGGVPRKYLEVWECEVEKGKKHALQVYYDLSLYRSIRKVVSFLGRVYSIMVPEGTVFCKSVRLLKRIDV